MTHPENDVKIFIEDLKRFLANEDARYVYADTVTNAFISAQIKSLREERALSQEDLAGLIGTKQSGISRLERQDYSAWKIDTLRKLARAFGVRLSVRFDEFGTLIDEIGGFNKKNLTPRKFEDDSVLSEVESIDAPNLKDRSILIPNGAADCVFRGPAHEQPTTALEQHLGTRKKTMQSAADCAGKVA